MQRNIVISILISTALIIGAIFLVGNNPNSSGDILPQGQNVEIRDGVQYITVSAKGGYFPRVSEVIAGVPTKLVIKTNGTYDCSLSLVIRQVGFQKVLQSTGEEVIDLGALKSGDKIQGVCGMGMYSFQIKVS